VGTVSNAPSAPDIAGTITGWRCWGLAKTDSGLLLASAGGTIWPARASLEAECDRHDHDPPGAKCTCGIYALAKGEGFPYYAYDGKTYAVYGEVALWGEVVHGTRGYRARYAYPKTLFLAHKDWRFAAPLRASYGVPVRLQNPFDHGGAQQWT
jgi:hypothetical protein